MLLRIAITYCYKRNVGLMVIKSLVKKNLLMAYYKISMMKNSKQKVKTKGNVHNRLKK